MAKKKIDTSKRIFEIAEDIMADNPKLSRSEAMREAVKLKVNRHNIEDSGNK